MWVVAQNHLISYATPFDLKERYNMAAAAHNFPYSFSLWLWKRTGRCQTWSGGCCWRHSGAQSAGMAPWQLQHATACIAFDCAAVLC
jgi:hypothetical protein